MKITEPLVSVIITTRNSSRTLEKCLESIKNQDYKKIELIVVDNNSTDRTKEIAYKYTDLVFNLGPERSAQRNYGASQSHGEYLLIHDSDIYFDEKSVSECVEIVKNSDADAIILPEKSVGEGFWTKVKAFERSFYVGNDYIEAPRFFKKEVFDKVGGYDENLIAAEDWDLGIRLKENDYKIEHSSKFLKHDEGKLSLLGSSKKKRYYSNDLFKKYALKHPEYFKKQMSFFVRFPFKKLLVSLFSHPILLFSMLLMKGLEYINAKLAYFL